MSHQLNIENLTDTITIDGKQYLLVLKPQIEQLLDDNINLKQAAEDHIKELGILRGAVKSILGVLGLLDEKTGTIKAEIQSGEESYTKHILKSLTKVVRMLALNQKKELEEKFAFIEHVIPVINKYANGNK